MRGKPRPLGSKFLGALVRDRFDMLTGPKENSLWPTLMTMLMAEMEAVYFRTTVFCVANSNHSMGTSGPQIHAQSPER